MDKGRNAEISEDGVKQNGDTLGETTVLSSLINSE